MKLSLKKYLLIFIPLLPMASQAVTFSFGNASNDEFYIWPVPEVGKNLGILGIVPANSLAIQMEVPYGINRLIAFSKGIVLEMQEKGYNVNNAQDARNFLNISSNMLNQDIVPPFEFKEKLYPRIYYEFSPNKNWIAFSAEGPSIKFAEQIIKY